MKCIWEIPVMALPVILLFAFIIDSAGSSEPNNVAARQDRIKLKVTIDPRVELMGVIFHLAGNPEYNKCKSMPYMGNLNEHFAGHRNHPAVKMAKKLRETRGVSYDAVMGMAMHIEDINSCGEIVPFEPRPDTLDGRWRIDEAREFLDSCRNFVKETDFKAFLAKNQSQYNTAVARLQQLIDTEANLAWFDEFFGSRDDVDFNLVISILNGPGNYGCRVRLEGRTKIYSILGAWRIDWLGWGNPTFNPNVVGTVVHEFGHSYCNPLVEQYMEDFSSFGEKYFPRVEKQMKGQAYGIWQTMMRESLVRACEVRYAMANDGRERAEQIVNYHISRGFHWTKELSELLGQYEQQRDKYQTLDAFMPKIVELFRNYDGPPEK
ncbi:MAG: hypothetical protein A2168_01600 [Planctomycetes bacterium RBG_13_50_24]|nr:MAG: hypothetical protein A2168_01600 [Planctomycetes bacterium RBG_13_50_24]